MTTIVGQGLAGTLLGWELEREGIPFRIFDRGHEAAASRVAAGIVNPVTGRRLAPTWRVGELLPLARASYRALGEALGIACWRDMRVRRFFRDEEERAIFQRRGAKGELAPHVTAPADADGFWIDGAGAVEVRRLIEAARARWIASGQLVAAEFAVDRSGPGSRVILCTGAGLGSIRCGGPGPGPGWMVAKGELLTVAVGGLAPGTILNRGHWVLPGVTGEARVGATYVSGVLDTEPTAAARAELAAAAAALCPAGGQVLRHEAGSRLALPDKRPVAGWVQDGVGVLGALGSKGVLFAPWLAAQWRAHLSRGAAFDPEVDAARFRA